MESFNIIYIKRRKKKNGDKLIRLIDRKVVRVHIKER